MANYKNIKGTNKFIEQNIYDNTEILSYCDKTLKMQFTGATCHLSLCYYRDAHGEINFLLGYDKGIDAKIVENFDADTFLKYKSAKARRNYILKCIEKIN